MSEAAEAVLQPLVFVDTNGIHYARLFLCFACQQGLSPFGARTDDPEGELKKAYGGRTQTLKDYRNGLKIVNYLQGKSNSGWQIEYAPISRLELVCGLLKGQAICDAAGEGIALRMWNRIDEHEILSRLRTQDYAAVGKAASDFEDQFAKVGIAIAETNPEHMKDVWALARIVLGTVFLDLGDCIVYASALLAEADELLTADGYLRFVANAIENPTGLPDASEQAYFVDVRAKITEGVAKAIEIEAKQIRLPKAPKSW